MLRLAPDSKSAKRLPDEIDPARALWMIRLLGSITLLLIVIAGVSLWWGSRSADALRVNVTAGETEGGVSIAFEARMTAGGRPIRDGDTVSTPTVTVHGILADYGRLREGLNGLSVTVQGTRVEILPETGEFMERVVLLPGKNQIDFGIWWDGREWQRRHVEVTYVKPVTETNNAQSL